MTKEKKTTPTEKQNLRLLLVGNPNSGKSTLFNALTGLNQRIGNFPGVTVEKKVGYTQVEGRKKVEIVDLPGTYSLTPRSEDEKVTYEYLMDHNRTDKEEIVVIIADASSLKRNLLLVTQMIDLEYPTILVLNMMDIVERNKQSIDVKGLEKALGVPVVPMNARLGKGVDKLKTSISKFKYVPAPKNCR